MISSDVYVFTLHQGMHSARTQTECIAKIDTHRAHLWASQQHRYSSCHHAPLECYFCSTTKGDVHPPGNEHENPFSRRLVTKSVCLQPGGDGSRFTMSEVIKQLRKAGFWFIVGGMLKAQWCGMPIVRDRYILVASRFYDIRAAFFRQVCTLGPRLAMAVYPRTYPVCVAQVACQCDADEFCWQCVLKTPKAPPGFFVVNLGSTHLTRPKVKHALDTFTRSSMPNMLVLPTCVEEADLWRPGTVSNSVGEVTMVRPGKVCTCAETCGMLRGIQENTVL